MNEVRAVVDEAVVGTLVLKVIFFGAAGLFVLFSLAALLEGLTSFTTRPRPGNIVAPEDAASGTISALRIDIGPE
ncbi:TPA: hypothetical protein ACV5IO_005612 [Pseudomonas aeruginosa]|uniref:hypothetical protein n=1 Tax=Pseudomonas aeruginosa TaxID=287 RepID=UPI0027373F28|nr:hypothetical protein [Pseudomonas aeruginosa]MDP2556081.1 hypothetical protein [Pseudomonas aeruginosa]